MTIVNAFQKVLDKSGRRQRQSKNVNQTKYGLKKEVNSTIVLCKKWLKDNDIEMYSIHNEGISVVPERFIRTLKTKIYKT